MDERNFLIAFAINQFNRQFNKRFKTNDCDIVSIVPNKESDIAYEINTVRFDDFVRIRIYLSIDKRDYLSDFRLETDNAPNGINSLSDEVFVASGTINKIYKELRLFKFLPIAPDINRLSILLTENDTPLLTESGQYFLLETGA